MMKKKKSEKDEYCNVSGLLNVLIQQIHLTTYYFMPDFPQN